MTREKINERWILPSLSKKKRDREREGEGKKGKTSGEAAAGWEGWGWQRMVEGNAGRSLALMNK